MNDDQYDCYLDELLNKFFPNDHDDTEIEVLILDNVRYFRHAPKTLYLTKLAICPSSYYLFLTDETGHKVNNLPVFIDSTNINLKIDGEEA